MLQTAPAVAGRRKMSEEKLARVRDTMTIERIKQIISTASDRNEGFTIQVVSRRVHSRAATVSFKNMTPSHVCITLDGRYGFCAEGRSYITTSPDNGLVFMNWLSDANNKGPKKEEYSQPTCEFRQTN